LNYANKTSHKINLKRRIFIPLLLTLFILFSSVIFNTLILHQREVRTAVEERKDSVQSLLASKIEDDTGMMSALLKIITRDENLQKAMMAKDRATLLKTATPLFERLRADHRITHVYFHAVDRRNLLRVHKPDKSGDYIGRFTMAGAAETGMESSGIELGPLGTFTLRVVTPWRVKNKLIGYVELGEEIDHIMASLREIMKIEYVVAIDKKYIDRKSWQAGLSLFERQGRWDRLPSAAVVASSATGLPDSLLKNLMDGAWSNDTTGHRVAIKGRDYYATEIPLKDAGHRRVGDLMMFVDITKLMAFHNASKSIHIAIYSVAGLALFFFFRRVVDRTEKDLAEAYEKTELEIMARRTAQERLKEANENLEGIVERRTKELSKEIEARKVVETELEKLAITDKLTRAYNRTKYDEIIANEIERVERGHDLLSVMMLDIDNFKHVNDTYGHIVGDCVLASVADLIRSKKRGIDHLVRWGGEEFIVVAPGAGIEGALKLAERLRASMEYHRFDTIGSLTVSVGVTEFKSGDTADSFIKRADELPARTGLQLAHNLPTRQVGLKQDPLPGKAPCT